jgi:hypothetical protein
MYFCLSFTEPYGYGPEPPKKGNYFFIYIKVWDLKKHHKHSSIIECFQTHIIILLSMAWRVPRENMSWRYLHISDFYKG